MIISNVSYLLGGNPVFNLFSGTRIIYDRNFLMQCRNSPLTKSPPANLPKIPGVTSPTSDQDTKENGHDVSRKIAGL